MKFSQAKLSSERIKLFGHSHIFRIVMLSFTKRVVKLNPPSMLHWLDYPRNKSVALFYNII
jgi:hypothetical protein